MVPPQFQTRLLPKWAEPYFIPALLIAVMVGFGGWFLYTTKDMTSRERCLTYGKCAMNPAMFPDGRMP